jgi:DNA repair exonuclease SbcCD ATPase subunit
MLELKSLSLQDFLMWKNQSFDFLPGVTMVSGENRSGKTLFFIRGITTALWGADAAKRGTDAAKMPEGSKSIAKFRSGSHEWSVTATSSRVSLTRDGKTLGLSGKKSGRTQFQELFGGPMDLYDSSVMVSCSKPNPLVLAPPLQRADWFGSLFGIDEAIAKAHEGVSETVSRMRKEKTELTFLEEQLAELQTERAKLAKTAMDAVTLSALQRQKKRDEKRIRNYTRAIDMLGTLKDYDKSKILPDKEVAELSANVKKLREKLEDAKIKQETARNLQAVMKQRGELYRRLNILKEMQAEATISVQDAKNIDKMLRPLEEKLARRNSKWSEYQTKKRRLRTSIKVYLGLLHGEPSASELKNVKENYSAAYDKAAILANSLKTLGDEVTDGVCPHCGSTVDAAELSGKKEALRKELAEVSKVLSRASKIKEYSNFISELAKLERTAPNPKLKLFLSRAIGMAITVWTTPENIEEIEKQLASMPKPQKTPTVQDMAGVSDELAGVEKKLARHNAENEVREANERAQSFLQDLLGNPDKTFTKQDAKTFKAELSRCRDRLTGVSDRIAKAEQANAVLDSLDTRIEKLEKSVVASKKAVIDLPFVEVLHRAFGRSGLRLTRIGELVDAFEATVNEGASLLLPEGYAFRMTTNDNGVDIKYRRPGEMVSDLSVLSGSEDKCWRLLCALALVRMCPSNMRVDTIVLDEMESLMSAQTRERFAKDFIPVLAEAVSKVVVVSPMAASELPISFDRRYNVQNQKGISKLIRQ